MTKRSERRLIALLWGGGASREKSLVVTPSYQLHQVTNYTKLPVTPSYQLHQVTNYTRFLWEMNVGARAVDPNPGIRTARAGNWTRPSPSALVAGGRKEFRARRALCGRLPRHRPTPGFLRACWWLCV